MNPELHFVQLDVFTSVRFQGNPLAIVHVPRDVSLAQEQKQRIAAEFNLSETVFLHEPGGDGRITIDIFTTTEELPFAGHPVVGTGWYLLSQRPNKTAALLVTKAGTIPVLESEGTVVAQIPIDFKVHDPFTQLSLKALQPQLEDADYVNGKNGAEAMVSIVKGMTFILLQVASEEALGRMQPYPSRFLSPNLGEWDGFIAVYGFFVREDGVVRTRMFDGGLEDPATGSAASALGGWLAKKKGPGEWKFEMMQGVEVGRPSEIMVTVVIESDGRIERIGLGGRAVEVMKGLIKI